MSKFSSPINSWRKNTFNSIPLNNQINMNSPGVPLDSRLKNIKTKSK